MNAGTWVSVATSAAALMSALAAYLKQRSHGRDPGAHNPPS